GARGHVDAGAHALERRERVLRGARAGDGAARVVERDEEPIALDADLGAAVAAERLTQQPVVLFEERRPCRAAFPDEAGRGLDVGGEQGDGPGGGGHGCARKTGTSPGQSSGGGRLGRGWGPRL